LAVLVLYGEILIVEFFPYRIFNEFVIATILPFIGKSALPITAARQVGA
jgi:hypothetical protein